MVFLSKRIVFKQIYETQASTTTLSQSGSESNGNEIMNPYSQEPHLGMQFSAILVL